MTDQSQPSEWWVLAWLVGGGLVGGAAGAVAGYLTYHPSDALLDFGRRFNVEAFGVIGLVVGVLVGFIAFWVWWIHRDDID